MERMPKPEEIGKLTKKVTEEELSESDKKLEKELEGTETWSEALTKVLHSIREDDEGASIDDEKAKLEFEEKYNRKMEEWKKIEKGFLPGKAGRFERESEGIKEKFRVDSGTLEKLESGGIRIGSKEWKEAKKEFSERWPAMKGRERYEHKNARNWSLRNLFLRFGLRVKDKKKRLSEISPDDPNEWVNLSERPKFNPDNAEHYAVLYEKKRHKPHRKSSWSFWRKEPVLKSDEDGDKEKQKAA